MSCSRGCGRRATSELGSKVTLRLRVRQADFSVLQKKDKPQDQVQQHWHQRGYLAPEEWVGLAVGPK